MPEGFGLVSTCTPVQSGDVGPSPTMPTLPIPDDDGGCVLAFIGGGNEADGLAVKEPVKLCPGGYALPAVALAVVVVVTGCCNGVGREVSRRAPAVDG